MVRDSRFWGEKKKNENGSLKGKTSGDHFGLRMRTSWEHSERERGKKKRLRNHERAEFNLKDTKRELQWSRRDGTWKQEEWAVSWSLKFLVRVEIFRYGHYGFPFLFFMFLLLHSLWFPHCLLGLYDLVIIGLIFHFLVYFNQEILECASVCCFIFKELVAFYALFWKPFPQLNPLIVKLMDKITKWVQHIG